MSIYQPDEDSYLIQHSLRKTIPKILSKNPSLKILEIGAGNGDNIKTLIDIGIPEKNITATDINSEAINYVNKKYAKKRIRVIQSDLFEGINKKEKFDVVFFNPPYLPYDGREDKDSRIATTSGKTGSEIINKFLIQAKKYLKEDGKIFLLTSSLTKKINWQDWKKRKIETKNLFMEKLYVWEIKR